MKSLSFVDLVKGEYRFQQLFECQQDDNRWPEFSNLAWMYRAQMYREEQRSLGDRLETKRDQFHRGVIV